MTLFGLPWWAWIPTALAWGMLDLTIALSGQILRHEHRLTCRAYWQWRIVTHLTSELAFACLWIALWGPYLGGAFIAWDVAHELLEAHALRRGATTTVRLHHLPNRKLGRIVLMQPTYIAGTVREAWRHRDHDDDCEHGPTKHWAGATARLRSWRKVALNPAFAPS